MRTPGFPIVNHDTRSNASSLPGGPISRSTDPRWSFPRAEIHFLSLKQKPQLISAQSRAWNIGQWAPLSQQHHPIRLCLVPGGPETWLPVKGAPLPEGSKGKWIKSRKSTSCGQNQETWPLGEGAICHKYGLRFRQLNWVSEHSGSQTSQGPTSGPLPARLDSWAQMVAIVWPAALSFFCVPKNGVSPAPCPLYAYASPQLWNLKEAHVYLTLLSSGLSWKGQFSMSSSSFPHLVLRSSSSMEKTIIVSTCGAYRH